MKQKILVKIAAVVAIIGLMLVGVPYIFGFATGFFNSLAAGYIAGGLMACAGLYAIVSVVSSGGRHHCNGKTDGDGPTTNGEDKQP